MATEQTPTTEREPSEDTDDEITLPVPGKRWSDNRPGELRCKQPGRQPLISEERISRICDRIRLGCYNWVACAAEGIGGTTFQRWVARGRCQRTKLDQAIEAGQTYEVPEAERLYLKFFDELEEARASARYEAEIEVKKANPLAWLRFGPGRERPGEEGWTESSKVEVTGKDGAPFNPTPGLPAIDPKKLSDAELADFRRLLEKATVDEPAD